MKTIIILMLASFTVHADYYVFPEVHRPNPIYNNQFADQYNADKARQIQRRQLQIQEQQLLEQQLHNFQQEQFMLNQQSYQLRQLGD